MAAGPTRTRTIRWEDPLASLERAATMSGLEFLRALAERRIAMPPIGALMGFESFVIEEGRAGIRFTPGEHHYNPVGTAHGGLAATALDAAMWCAIQSTLPPGSFCQTLDISVNYVRPMSADTGDVVARGEVIHRGRSVATADGRIVGDDGRLYAHSKTTSIVLSM